MNILLFIALTFVAACAHAQAFLFFNDPINPFCKLMLPFMGVAIAAAIGYGVVKIIREKDDVQLMAPGL